MKHNMQALSDYQTRIHTALLTHLPPADELPQQLHQAMHYAVFNGGKRLRPLLTYAVGEMLEANLDKIDVLACAVELIHSYSLIHDDLPAMDNDDWRRGKPSCHKAFDEATAILAGDALQTLAFESIAFSHLLTTDQRLHAIALLASASGSRGMAGGQMLDLIYSGQSLSLDKIEHTYRLKTGALIKTSILMGVIAANIPLSSDIATSLSRFADCTSLAFQIQDDILDIEGNIDSLGKTPGGDQRHAKPTYAVVAGLEIAKQKVNTLQKEAALILAKIDMPVNPLQQVLNIVFPQILSFKC
jgi:geranylgeranyl pyrophosphate synthase